MGCDASKSSIVVDNTTVPEEASTEFTENQIDTITSTWPLLACDMVGNGSKVFSRLFVEEPKLKRVFNKFSSMNENEMLNDKYFQDHVVKFMNAIGAVVESLEGPMTEVQQLLLILGAKHATYEEFDTSYFYTQMKCMMAVWESAMGEEFIPEVKESWKVLFTFIIKHICKGYELYMNETITDENRHSNEICTDKIMM